MDYNRHLFYAQVSARFRKSRLEHSAESGTNLPAIAEAIASAGGEKRENFKELFINLNGRPGCTQLGSLQIDQDGHQKRDPENVEYNNTLQKFHYLCKSLLQNKQCFLSVF